MKPMVVIIPVSPIGILSLYNYYSGDPQAKRRRTLNKMIKKHRYKDIISRLSATATRLKNTQPRLSRNLRNDMLYLKRKYRPDLLKN
jgi:hypothetical protein